ncbi:MAG: sodium:proton antiporter [Desulfurococcaceae archaeon]|nr:sodium:proton antiporter [Desulfurococcaceae archaeon]
MEAVNTYLLSVTLASLLVNFAISLYAMFFKPHYVKKVIALTILGDTVNTFAIYIGYRRWVEQRPPRVPVLTDLRPEAIEEFKNLAVDPLPQALVLTAIVIGLAVILFLVFLGWILYSHYRTLDMREIKRLKG